MEPKPLTRLLAATDGSDTGEHALGVARQLAERVRARLEVLAVETAGLPAVAEVGEPILRTASLPGVQWVRGIPGVEIVRRASQFGADLIVLGRRDRQPEHPLPLGSTADTIVRRHDGPCLLIPPAVSSLSRMVLALDGTRRGLGVLQPAAMLVAAWQLEVLPVHVLPSTAQSEPEEPWGEPSVQRIQEGLSAFPLLQATAPLQVLRGAPVSRILEWVGGNRADLLVLGVRGGGPRGEMGSGHVGRDLLRAVPVAILTVPI